MKTLRQLTDALRLKKMSSVELTKQYLEKIEKKNPELNAFISVHTDSALSMARNADEMIKNGEHKALTGIPLGVKDVFCEKGIETTACSKILKGFIPPYEGTVMSRLRKAGAVFLGHTNTDEFTMGSSTETSCYGTSRNPHDTTRSPGGSSGGSAAAVASGLCSFALGTDTGGSIRHPASFCGITGLKVSYGRVSRYGVMSMASSLDTIGPITLTPQDAAIVLQSIAGHDEKDSTTPDFPVQEYSKLLEKPVKGLVAGVPKEYLEGVPSDARKVFDDFLKKAETVGMRLEPISLPMTAYGISVYYVIAPCEISANMARYDGIRFGPKSEARSLVESYFEARTKGFGDEVKRRIIIGTYALSAGYYDAYYRKALKARTLILNDFKKAFESVDVIFTPTTPSVAFPCFSKASDPVQMYLEDVMTIPASVAGIPGISIPSGKLGNLPLGFQILGPHFEESLILRVAHQLYQHSPYVSV